MKSLLLMAGRAAALAQLLHCCNVACADEAPTHAQAGSIHSELPPESMEWKPLSADISFAVLSGSMEGEGAPFVIRIKLADGARVPPHWHPVDEHLTVVSGVFHMGIGETFDESKTAAMNAGTYCVMPRDVRHFAWVAGETVVQIHGIGPFKTSWVEPAKQ